jgi:hypothetical protein
VIQFLLQAPLRNDKRLWQPSAGMPFFEKTTTQADGGIGRYQGFAARALVAPSGKIGLCVDVRSKYVRTEPLPNRLDRLNFRQHKGRVCVYRYGHQWYKIRIDTLSDLNASEETIRTPDRELSLLDYIVQQCEKPIPAELAALPNDAAVVRYRTRRGDTRTAAAGHLLLNEAWSKFWHDPRSYHQWEMAAVAQLRALCNSDRPLCSAAIAQGVV